MTAGGIALVVAILVLTLALANGFRAGARRHRQSRQRHHHPRRLQQRGPVRLQPGNGAHHRVDAGGGATAPTDRPSPSAEVVVVTNLTERNDPVGSSNVTVRGADARALLLRPEVRLVEGRLYRPGVPEVIVGSPISQRFVGCGLGRDGPLRRAGVEGGGGLRGGRQQLRVGDLGRRRDPGPRLRPHAATARMTLRLADPASGLRVDEEAARGRPAPARRRRAARTTTTAPSRSSSPTSSARSASSSSSSWRPARSSARSTPCTPRSARARRRSAPCSRSASRRRASCCASSSSRCCSALVGGVLGCLLALPIHGVSTGTTNWSSFSEVAFKFRITPGILAHRAPRLDLPRGRSAATSRRATPRGGRWRSAAG